MQTFDETFELNDPKDSYFDSFTLWVKSVLLPFKSEISVLETEIKISPYFNIQSQRLKKLLSRILIDFPSQASFANAKDEIFLLGSQSGID